MRRTWALLLAPLLLGGCTRHVDYEPDQGQRLQRVAIVVRVLNNATVDVPEGLRQGKTPEQLSDRLDQVLNTFEIAERLRSGLVQHLPDQPPWNNIVPTVQAESAMGSLLTVDKPVHPPDLDALQQLGVDGVLYVQIDSWGARTVDSESDLYMQGVGKFITLPDHDTIWQSALDSPAIAPLGTTWTNGESLRDQFDVIAGKLGTKVALQLGGTPDAVERTPSLQTPDIEDTGHPPPQLQPVIPFAVPDAGSQVRDAGGGIDLGFGDGGLP